MNIYPEFIHIYKEQVFYTIEGDTVCLINHAFVIIKRNIHITGCREGGTMNKEPLLDYIRYYFNLERYILVHKKGSMHIFENKWSPVTVVLDSHCTI